MWWTRDSLDIKVNFFVKLFNKIKWRPGHSINHNFEWLTFWRLVKSEMTSNWLIPWCPNIVPYPGVITKTITFLSQANKKLQSVTPHIMWLAKQPILRYCQKIYNFITESRYDCFACYSSRWPLVQLKQCREILASWILFASAVWFWNNEELERQSGALWWDNYLSCHSNCSVAL